MNGVNNYLTKPLLTASIVGGAYLAQQGMQTHQFFGIPVDIPDFAMTALDTYGVAVLAELNSQTVGQTVLSADPSLRLRSFENMLLKPALVGGGVSVMHHLLIDNKEMFSPMALANASSPCGQAAPLPVAATGWSKPRTSTPQTFCAGGV